MNEGPGDFPADIDDADAADDLLAAGHLEGHPDFYAMLVSEVHHHQRQVILHADHGSIGDGGGQGIRLDRGRY